MIQIKLLRVLGHLGTSDKQASDNMYSVVAESMRRGNTGHTIGNAIVYEAVRTIASIYPNPALLQSGDAQSLSQLHCLALLQHLGQHHASDCSEERLLYLIAWAELAVRQQQQLLYISLAGLQHLCLVCSR